MRDIKEKALKEFIERIKEKYPEKITKIIIFGSYVQGDFTEESDIDILIIGEVTLDQAIDVSYPIMLKYGVYISPKVKTPQDFDAHKNYSFLKRVIEEGIAV